MKKVSILYSYQSILKLLIILYQKKENQLFVSVSIQFDQNIQHVNEEFLVPRKWFQIKKQYLSDLPLHESADCIHPNE